MPVQALIQLQNHWASVSSSTALVLDRPVAGLTGVSVVEVAGCCRGRGDGSSAAGWWEAEAEAGDGAGGGGGVEVMTGEGGAAAAAAAVAV